MSQNPYSNRITRWGDPSTARHHADDLINHLGQLHNPELPKKLRRSFDAVITAASADARAALMVGRAANHDTGDQVINAFVADSVLVAAPRTAYAVKVLMTTVTRYVVWCVREKGWPLTGQVIWSVRAIDLYTTTANLTRSTGTRSNYRGQLMRISEVLLPDEHPDRPSPMGKRDAKQAYTPAELDSFREWPGLQLTALKRDRAMLMLTLCAGAALRPNELPLLHHEHVTVDNDGIVIHLPGPTARDIPLLAEWEDWMTLLLERRPEGKPLWGALSSHSTHNLTSAFTEGTEGDKPRADRLRVSWLVRHLTLGTPMKEVQRAYGVEKFTQLHLHLGQVPARSNTDYRRLLRGEVQA